MAGKLEEISRVPHPLGRVSAPQGRARPPSRRTNRGQAKFHKNREIARRQVQLNLKIEAISGRASDQLRELDPKAIRHHRGEQEEDHGLYQIREGDGQILTQGEVVQRPQGKLGKAERCDKDAPR